MHKVRAGGEKPTTYPRDVIARIWFVSRPGRIARQPRLHASRTHSLRESWPSLRYRRRPAALVEVDPELQGPSLSPFACLCSVYAAASSDIRWALFTCVLLRVRGCFSRGRAASDGGLSRGSCPGFARLGGIWASLYGFYRSTCDHGFAGMPFTCGFDAGGCLLPVRRAGRGRKIYTGNGVLPRFAETPVTEPRCLLFADACVHGVCRSARKNALVERRLVWCGGRWLLGRSAHLRFCRCWRASGCLAFVWVSRRRSTSAFFGPERETPRIGPPPRTPRVPRASRARAPRFASPRPTRPASPPPASSSRPLAYRTSRIHSFPQR